MKIYLLSKNKAKLEVAESVFKETSITIEPFPRDIPEIQASTSVEIALAAVREAIKDTDAPVIREDHSLFLNTFGFPGPFMNYIEKQLSPEKLLTLLQNQSDRTGYFELGMAYASLDGVEKTFSYQIPIHILTKENTPDYQGGWRGLLALEGEIRAFSEYPEDEQIQAWQKNFQELRTFLGH